MGCYGNKDFPSLATYTPGDLWLSKYLQRVHDATGGVQHQGLSGSSPLSGPRIHGPCAMRKERVPWGENQQGQGCGDCVKRERAGVREQLK